MPQPAARRAHAALTCLAAVLLPVSALACPTELGAGLVYTSEDASRTTVTPTDRPEVQRDRTLLAEGDGYELTSYFGVFDILTFDFDAQGAAIEDSRETSTYAAAPELPGPEASVIGIVAQVSGYGDPLQRRLDAVAGPMGEVVFGDCRYQGYPIELRRFEAGGPVVHLLIRVPQLGATFYVGYEDETGREDYTVTGIEVLEPATK